MSTGQVTTASRPGVVTFVGIVVYINAAIAAVNSIGTFMNSDSLLWRDAYNATTTQLIWLAIFEAALAVLLLLVGSGVMSGAKWARMAVAVVIGLRVVSLSWWMLTHLGNGIFTWNLIIAVAFGLFVLWALYGKDESNVYYEGSM